MEKNKSTNTGCGKLLLIALGILLAITLVCLFISANAEVGDTIDAIIVVVLILAGIYLARN